MINYSIAIMSSKPGTRKADIQETKAYGMAQASEVLDINKFAEHIAAHGSVYGKGDIVGLLTIAFGCLRELMLEGKRVRLGDMGDFQPRLKTIGAKTTEEFSPAYIKDVHVRWTPGKSFRNLRSEATFQLVPSRKAQGEAIETVKNTDTIQGLE
ncbi:MAG: DNA-binding protein [Bacteroidaceae bacterium]|nr:DNA-binding protein [Bacteroidaceae bacterium]